MVGEPELSKQQWNELLDYDLAKEFKSEYEKRLWEIHEALKEE